MIQFATSKLGAMVLALGLTAMAVAPAQAFGHHRGGGCHGGYGCCGGGGWYGGCCGGGYGGCYGGWGYGCCGGGYYGGWGYGGSGMYRGGSGSRIDYYGPYMGYQSMPYDQRSYYYSPGGNGNGSGSPATIEVRVPQPDAQVWFDDYLTRQTGQTRTFQTPALSADSDATYTVRVRWNDKGQPMEQTKQVVVRGGKQAQLDFSAENIPGSDTEKGARDRDRDRDRGTDKEKGSPQREKGSPGK